MFELKNRTRGWEQTFVVWPFVFLASTYKLTEKKLADFSYSVVITDDVSDIAQGHQIWEEGRVTTVIVSWFEGRTYQNHIKWYN